VISPEKLPARALIDTGVLIRALGQKIKDPRAPLCKEFWDAMLSAKRQILIAAPTITETTRSTDFPATPPPSSPNVLVVAFDLQAALICAQKFPEQVLRNEHQATGLVLNYLRYDALILACAIRYDAVLVTLDAPMSKLASNAALECKRPEDFEDQLSMKAIFASPPSGK
jgi:predicted nucleic acid-binding protein